MSISQLSTTCHIEIQSASLFFRHAAFNDHQNDGARTRKAKANFRRRRPTASEQTFWVFCVWDIMADFNRKSPCKAQYVG
jgi:hypothetical protein